MSRSRIGGGDTTHNSRTARAVVIAVSVFGFLHTGSSQAFAESGYFIHLADPHVTVLTQPLWAWLLEDILEESPPPDFVLCTGDLVDFGAGLTGAANYDALLSPPITTDSGDYFIGEGDGKIPIFFCPGNHDYRNILQATEDLTNYKAKVHSETYFHRIIGSYAIFSVNSGEDALVTHPHTLPEGAGLFNSVADPDVDSLEYDLDMLDGVQDGQNTSEDYKTIIFMHHPHSYPDEVGGDPVCSLDGIFLNYPSSNYPSHFVNMCQNYGVDWVLYGHLHPDESMVFNLGCGEWTAGETKCIIGVSARTNGYRRESTDGTGEDVMLGAIPTVSTWGVVAMTLLVLTAGTVVVRRRLAVA